MGQFFTSATRSDTDPKRITNVRLKKLLLKHFKCTLTDTYATNVFPFVKHGPMSARIDSAILLKAASEFAVRQIEIVAPRFAVCLGKVAFGALASAAGRPRAQSLNDAISSPFMLGKTKVWCQSHTGQMGVNNRGGIENISKDWAAMAEQFFSGRT